MVERESTSLKKAAWRRRGFALLCAAIALALLAAGGCGLQTDEANKDLEKANAHQQQAEAIIAKLKALPTDWQNIFNTPGATPQEITAARALIAARVADLDSLTKEIHNWSYDINAISKLNVDDKIKEYVKLKSNSINQWEDYALTALTPLVKSYNNLLDSIALGQSAVQQQAAAAQIMSGVSDSIQKLEDCLDAQKTADNYFKTNKLGK